MYRIGDAYLNVVETSTAYEAFKDFISAKILFGNGSTTWKPLYVVEMDVMDSVWKKIEADEETIREARNAIQMMQYQKDRAPNMYE